MPVLGEYRALIPTQCGSSSRSRSGPIISRPSTPLAWPRCKEVLEPWQLAFGDRDDHLAAAIGRDALLFAIGVHLALSLDAETRLERPGRVVDAGVQHPAVVSGLVLADARLFVEDRQPQTRVAAE